MAIDVKALQPINDLAPIVETLSGIMISEIPEHPESNELLIFVRRSERVIDPRMVHPERAPAPISVTLDGILIDASIVQPWNALSPIVWTLAGILIDLRLVHPSNAEFPILVTEFPMTAVLKSM